MRRTAGAAFQAGFAVAAVTVDPLRCGRITDSHLGDDMRAWTVLAALAQTQTCFECQGCITVVNQWSAPCSDGQFSGSHPDKGLPRDTPTPTRTSCATTTTAATFCYIAYARTKWSRNRANSDWSLAPAILKVQLKPSHPITAVDPGQSPRNGVHPTANT